jgi:serralysin
MKYYTLASAAVLAALISPAFAATDVDFASTHFFKTEKAEKQYVIDALTPYSLSRWNYDSPLGSPVTINYAFGGTDFGYVAGTDVQRNFYQYEKDAIVEELIEVSKFTNITFVEVVDSSAVNSVNIIFRITTGEVNAANLPPIDADTDSGFKIVTYSESTNMRYLNPARESTYERFTSQDVDYKHDYSRSKWMIIHELGHALGLYHPFSTENNPHAIAPLNGDDQNMFNTVMSYNLPIVQSESYGATSFKGFDVIALQHLYGKNVNKNTGDSLYEYDDTYSFHQVIVDTDGNDTISVANSERDNVIDLRSGYFSSIAPNYIGWYYESCNDSNNEPIDGCEHLGRTHNSLTLDVDSVIENATGGNGDDTLVANSVPNMLNGGDGLDTAMFAGNKADYTIEIVDSYNIVVTSVADSSDVDDLKNFEFIKFADETITLNQAPVVTLPETVTVRETLQAIIAVTVSDSESDELTYTWTQVSGTEVALTGADALNVNFTAPAVDVEETITLQLVVSDGTNVVTNTVDVVVIPNNTPVITDVTADQSINEGDTVTLNVTATDADNDNLTYRWVVNGATVTLTGSTTDTITFTAPDVTSDTALTVQVFVSDGFDEVSSETRTVTVKNVATVAPETKPAEKSSGGSFGWLMILLTAGLVVRRK